jgi:uncharacterized protein (DUF58 family)
MGGMHMPLFGYIAITGLLIILQSVYYARFGLRGVEYRRYFSKQAVFEGEAVELVEVLQNRKFAPLPWVRVESRISPHLRFGISDNLDINADTFHKSVFFLRGYRSVTRRHSVQCAHRGVYNLSQSFLTVGDLMNAGGKTMELQHEATLYVYPRLLEASEMPPALHRLQGDIAVRRFIQPDPVLIAGIREYLPGDAQRDIHWRATARTGHLQVKVRDYTISPKLLVVLNIQPAEEVWARAEEEQAESMEHSVRIAATFCAEGIRAGLDVGFLCNGITLGDKTAEVRIPSHSSEAHLYAILHVMARLHLQRRVALHTLLDAEAEAGLTGHDIVVLSTYWNAQLEERAARLRNQSNSVAVVQTGGPL